jgi:hypothetical protein
MTFLVEHKHPKSELNFQIVIVTYVLVYVTKYKFILVKCALHVHFY